MPDQRHPEHNQLHDRLDSVEKTVLGKIEAVLEQARITNGRTTRMEHVLFGVPGRLMRDGEPDRGMQGQFHQNQQVIDTIQRVGKGLKWATYTFGAAALGLAGNLAAGLF